MNQDEFVLGANQFGKAEVRVVKIDRSSDRHSIDDLNVSSALKGDFESAYRSGSNEHILTTDTQKNTIFGFARDGISSPEEFLLRLSQHFTSKFEWIHGGRWEAERYNWDRIPVDGAGENHSFVRSGQETRTAMVVKESDATHLLGGLHGLTVLKSTASGFKGYPKDAYTTLPETDDRILSTSVAARWRYNTADLDFNSIYADVKVLLLTGFAERYSHALQQTLFEMGGNVLKAHPEIDEIRFSMPNKHHFAVDLSPFGQDNPDEVFFAADRPYGLIEATVARDEATDPGSVWDAVAGFC